LHHCSLECPALRPSPFRHYSALGISPAMAKICGTVKFFSAKRGYGFIIPDDPEQDGQEYFVHHSVIQGEGFRSLATGEEVQFEVSSDSTTHKLVAVNVTGPEGAAVQGGSKPGFKGAKGGGKGFGGKGLEGGKSSGKGKGDYKGDGGKPALKGGKGSGYPSKGGDWGVQQYDSGKGGKYGYRDSYKGAGKGYKGYDSYDAYDDYDYWGYKGSKGYGKGYDDYGYKGGKSKGGYPSKGGYKGDYYDDYDYFDDYKGYKGRGPSAGSKGGYKGAPSKGKDEYKGGYGGKGGFKGDSGGFKGGRKGKYDYY